MLPPRESCYIVTKSSGVLGPKEEKDIKVGFLPVSIGRFSASLVIECKGVSFKEVALSGIGAVMKLKVLPEIVDLGTTHIFLTHKGRCSYKLETTHIITLKNMGDVTVYASFQHEKNGSSEACELICPEDVEIKPRDTVRCPYAVIVNEIGRFQTTLMICTREKVYKVPIFGVSIRIDLSSKGRAIIAEENLSNVS